MELRIDPNITYALALEGGGAKGAWQIGAWRALREAGIRVNAVAGSSVGSLNGALIAMGDLEKAEEIWRNIRYSQVMDVDDDAMSALMSGELGGGGWKDALGQLWAALRNGGFDVTPLQNWIREIVDEKKVRESPTELFVVTYSVSDKTELEFQQLCEHLGILPSQLLMVGNSLKSDIAPALAVGASAIHIPFHVTWQLEHFEDIEHERLVKIAHFNEIIHILNYHTA